MTKNLSIGQGTGHLLDALRHIEDAKNSYYEALLVTIGQEEADKLMRSYAPKFDAASELIEHDITDNIRYWAICTDRPSIL